MPAPYVLEAIGMKIVVSGGPPVVAPTDLRLEEGEIFGLVGESGSGKTTLGLATMGYTRPGLKLAGGEVRIDGAAADAAMKRRISYVPQNPGTALNPAMTLRTQLAESLPEDERKIAHRDQETILLRLLSEVKLPANAAFLDQYPHQLSGGQQQRVCIAMAFAARPRLVVMDEPTTGLDVTTQRFILDMVRHLCVQYRSAVLYISHDLAVVADLCQRVAVMQHGRIVELGLCAAVLRAPKYAYTKKLLRSVPEFDPEGDGARAGIEGRLAASGPAPAVSLSVKRLSASHGGFKVIADLSLDVRAGEFLALVGESGSGKTTLARCIAGLHASATGEIRLEDILLQRQARQRTAEQRRRIQYIFQNPYAAFNPKRTIGASLAAALQAFGMGGRRDGHLIIGEVIRQVALDDTFLARYPHQLSGGQRQRVAIARALLARPDILICDEITSALDVSVQAVIIELLEKLRMERNLTLLFVTHNMALVRNFAQRAAVMHKGAIVEQGPVGAIFARPEAEETQRLIRDTPHFSSRLLAAGTMERVS